MTNEEMIDLLNADLRNEWKHLRFYLYHASAVVGLHCEEYKELFLKEAAGEMAHVTAFSDVIIGMGGTATHEANDFPLLRHPEEILKYALKMEEEVVRNYVERMKQTERMENVVDGQWLEIFLEGQIQDSREDVDHFRQIVRGFESVDLSHGC